MNLLEGQLVQIDVVHHLFLPERTTGVVAPVEIERSDERLESVAAHKTVVGTVRTADAGRLNHLRDAHLVSQTSEHLALDKFGAGVGQETLPPAGEMAENHVTHHGVKHRIPQKLQALILHVSERLAI